MMFSTILVEFFKKSRKKTILFTTGKKRTDKGQINEVGKMIKTSTDPSYKKHHFL